MIHLALSKEPGESMAMNKEFIQKLTRIVEANMANEAFGTEDLAREMGMSHSNLHRKLKAISNQTISQFIRETRLNKAKELLLNEQLTASETAYRVGFGSPTYFNKCFHEYFGYAPGELRKEEYWSERKIPVENTPQKRRQTKIMKALFFILIILVPLFVFMFDKTKKIEAVNEEEKSIAVLPFKYMSDELDKQYLADGMMDAILLHLGKIKDLRVISMTSVEQYRHTTKTIGQIGKELNVAYLLEGSYQKDGDKIRLILQLLKTKDEEHVWASDYDREWKDVFLVQSEVAEIIANELHAAITPEEIKLIHKIPTENLTAYDFYQRGKEILDTKQDSVSLAKALILFKKALRIDSTYALAYSGLARINYTKYYAKTFFSKNFLDSVLILANKALSYDDQCAEAYFFRGAYYYERAKPNEALNEMDKALKFNPNYWMAFMMKSHIFLVAFKDYIGTVSNLQEAISRNRGKNLPDLFSTMGDVFVEIGFPDLGKQFYQQELELKEDSARYLLNLAWIEYCCGNLENAYQLAKSVNKKDTNRINFLSLFCTLTSRFDEAYRYTLKDIEQLKQAGEIDYWSSKGIGYILWKKGRTREAKYYFNQQIKIDLESIELGRWNAVQKGAQFDLAAVYAFLGDHRKAYQYLDEVIKIQSFPLWHIILFKNDPLFESIRQEPRFQNLIKEAESKYQAEHERVKNWLIAQHML